MGSIMPAPIDSLPRRKPRRLERLVILYSDTFLAEAIASAARSEGYGTVQAFSSVPAAMHPICTSQPTLLLGDTAMLAANDFDLLYLVTENAPQTRVVAVLEAEYDPQLAVDVLTHGVAGLACRDQGVASLFRVLDLVRDGETVVPRQLTQALVGSLRMRPQRAQTKARLSARQQDVLRLVARGASDKDICRQLNISLTTVRSHLAAIFEKTETGNRVAAALWASIYLEDVAS